MLTELMTFLTEQPEANSFAICERFGLSRGMCERLLCQLEDMGFLAIEQASGGCSGGGCSSGGCSSGGCSTAGPAATINALATAARAAKQA
jgi:hypothetical protein